MHFGIADTVKVSLIALSIVLSTVGCGPREGEGNAVEPKTEPEAAADGEKLPEGLTSEQAAKIVARVGEREITVGDVTRQINKLSPYIRRRWAAPEKRKEFLDKLIRVELLSQEAERLGLGKDPEVQRTVNQVMIRLLVKNDLEKEILPTGVDEDKLKAEYDNEHEKYHRSAQVRASHIVVGTKNEATQLISELKQNAKDARLFRQKARELSLDEKTKDRGGDLGYFSSAEQRREDEPVIDKNVVDAAWKLQEVGSITREPLKTEKGFHVVKLTNKRPEMNRSFESVKRIIENRLLRDMRRESMDNYVDGLKKEAKIEMFSENLDKLEVSGSIPGQRPPIGKVSPQKPVDEKTKKPEAKKDAPANG